MKKIRITEGQLHRMIEDAASAILKARAGQRREPKYDEDGVEIPAYQDDMNNPEKYVPFDMEHSDWESIGKPRGWQELYLKAIRNDGIGDNTKLRDAAWKALKKERPDPKDRNRVFNDFSKKIDAFRGYEPQRLDSIADDDPNADWNKGRRVRESVEQTNIGDQFLNFIEKYHGGVLLQTIVDYESGNQTGEPCSPLPTLIGEFEDAVMDGEPLTPEMKQEIKRKYNEWWYYAQGELMPDEENY